MAAALGAFGATVARSHDALVARFAIVADIFVNGHSVLAANLPMIITES